MKNKIFEEKSILIAIPDHFGLPQRFKENLEFLGFKVFVLQNTNKISIPLKDKIIHGFRKIFFKDKTYKPSMKNKISEQGLFEQLSEIKKVDYAFFIRPDLFSFKIVEKVKQISNKIVAYQWDGLDRYPLAKKYISLFDDFYVFDKNDLKINCKLKHTTNFYFDDIVSEKEINPKSVFFVGTYIKNRVPLLEEIIKILETNGLAPDIFLVSNKKSTHHKFRIISEGFSFKESILRIQNSEFLLDLYNPIHNGLSFRTFESVGYEKKLITNNLLVKEYDFYNPNNIFVIENNNFDGFSDFVKTPYQHLDIKIKEKYSFTNWIRHLL